MYRDGGIGHENNIMNKYIPMTIVGEGTYGMVVQCLDTNTGRVVAVKKLKKALTSQHGKMIVREIRLLRALAADHIVPLIEAFRKGSYVYMVFPLQWGNLHQYMVTHVDGLTKEDIKSCVYQVCVVTPGWL